MDLVHVSNKKAVVGSQDVAKNFSKSHKNVMTAVRKIIKDAETHGLILSRENFNESTYRTQRGKVYENIVMDRDGFTLLAMGFTGKKALEWKLRYIEAFNLMEDALLKVQTNKADIEWNQKRLIGKSARAEETDAIEEFVEYAVAQGSKGARWYYKHITNHTYKALGFMAQKFPKLRDEMNIYELGSLMLAEKLVADNIRAYMAAERKYKDIYDCVKADLLAFADAVRPLQQPMLEKQK